MKVLFDNALAGGALSSVNASPNYPAGNLLDGFLRVRYQVAATTDSVTILLANAAPVDSIYFGYMGGVTGISVELFVADVSQGANTYFDDYAGEAFASAHFTSVASVNKIVVTFTGTNPFYVGGVSAGAAVDMPSPDAAWQDSLEDNSIVVRSSHGQVQQQYIEPYKRFMFSFNGVGMTEFDEIKTAALSVGRKPVWVTFFEDSPTDYPPGYYSATLNNPQRDRRLYRFTMTFEEAR